MQFEGVTFIASGPKSISSLMLITNSILYRNKATNKKKQSDKQIHIITQTLRQTQIYMENSKMSLVSHGDWLNRCRLQRCSTLTPLSRKSVAKMSRQYLCQPGHFAPPPNYSLLFMDWGLWSLWPWAVCGWLFVVIEDIDYLWFWNKQAQQWFIGALCCF